MQLFGTATTDDAPTVSEWSTSLSPTDGMSDVIVCYKMAVKVILNSLTNNQHMHFKTKPLAENKHSCKAVTPLV